MAIEDSIQIKLELKSVRLDDDSGISELMKKLHDACESSGFIITQESMDRIYSFGRDNFLSKNEVNVE